MPGISLSRRRFTMLLGGAGGLAALGYAGWARADGTASSELKTVTRTSWALGTDISLTVLHADVKVAEEALAAAFKELDALENILSVYRPHSQVSRLNMQGSIEHPHRHILTVLAAAQKKSEMSGGAFDVSVAPLWDLYFAAKKKNALPSDSEIDAARAKVDYRRIEFNEKRVSLAPGMKVTFNGIAQGYAADCVLNVLQGHGIQHALIDTGELRADGRKSDGTPFRVGIQHPRKPDAFVTLCALDQRALATSGDYATYFSDDFVYNHIFDPKTGRSPREFASVSVAAPAGLIADGLSTALFVLGRERALALLEKLPDCDAFFVTKDGQTFKTKNFPEVHA